jgi:hypothetical protein
MAERTIEALAPREGKSERSIWMTLSVAFLSPTLATAAIDGAWRQSRAIVAFGSSGASEEQRRSQQKVFVLAAQEAIAEPSHAHGQITAPSFALSVAYLNAWVELDQRYAAKLCGVGRKQHVQNLIVSRKVEILDRSVVDANSDRRRV